VGPVVILPVANDAVLAEPISPVVPFLASGGIVWLPVLLIGLDDIGKNEVLELLDGFVSGHYFV